MTEAQPPESRAQDPLVERLVSDPPKVEGFATLAGFLGNSDREGYQRLYTDPTLGDWFEIPKDAIVHIERLSGDNDAFGGRSFVWLKPDATLERSSTNVDELEDDFLQGELMDTPVGRATFALRRRRPRSRLQVRRGNRKVCIG